MVRVLSDEDVAAVLELPELLEVVADAFRADRVGAVERPARPHFPVGEGLDGRETPAGTGLAMPAYVHGDPHYATKLVSVHEGNADRGLPTVQAQVALTEADTGRPAAYLAGTRITNARTGCIGGLAARELAAPPVDLAVIGAGRQARWQARAIAAATDLDRVRVYSPSDSRVEYARELSAELGVEVTPVETPLAAVDGATVVVTATTATEPVFPGEALAPGTLVVAVGAYTADTRELDDTTVERARRIYADVPEEVAGIGDVPDLEPEEMTPFAAVLDGDGPDRRADAAPREDGAGDSPREDGPGDLILVESVGTAVLDAAAAGYVLAAAREVGVGTEVGL